MVSIPGDVPISRSVTVYKDTQRHGCALPERAVEYTYMRLLNAALPYAQMVFAALLIVAILLQQRGSSLGGAFGADGGGGTFYTRRGAERVLFQLTFALGILFVLSAFFALFV